MIEPVISLPEATRLLGIDRHTLKRWLRIDLGIVFEPCRGAKRFIKRSDLELLIRIHSGKKNWTEARKGRTAA